ncbi:MAG: type II toxin-antitoxin system HicA family toxin [Symbiobacteriia bacterium]
MTGLNNLKRDKILRTLQHLGWAIEREGGKHTIMRHQAYPDVRLTIPRHKAIAPGTLRAMLKESA